MDLSASRWAPENYAYSSSKKDLPRHQDDVTTVCRDECEKYERLLRRLRWKASLLIQSYQRTTLPQFYAGVVPSFLPAKAPWPSADSQAMFKIDFFEFFVLLERIILHVLNILGISVSRDSPGFGGANESPSSKDVGEPSAQKDFIFATSGKFPLYSHRFHANVLETLDRPSNPLHSILGQGEVRRYLAIAKECRNRWKDVDQRGEANANAQLPARDEEKFLNMLDGVDLEKMLHSITDALDHAKHTIDQALTRKLHTESIPPNGKENIQTSASTSQAEDMVIDNDMSQGPWEAMPDAMDWDEF